MQFYVLSLLGGVGTGGVELSQAPQSMGAYLGPVLPAHPPTCGHLLWEVIKRIRSQIQV